MKNPIDGPGRYITRNGETVNLVQHDESLCYVAGYFLYGTQATEPETGHLVFPGGNFEHPNDIMSKA